VFEIIDREAPKGKTYLQAFITPIRNKPRARTGHVVAGRGRYVPVTFAQIADGTSNTVAVVEARDA